MADDRPVSQAELPGVWKRTVLVDEIGVEDLQSQVYWIQSSTMCGDIRKHLQQSALADLSSNGGAPMMDAFVGKLTETDGIFRWQPSLSYRDPNGPPDEGRLRWIGEDLSEHGVHSAYRERWVRIARASDDDFALALRHPEDDRRSWVIKVGPFLFFACEAIGETVESTEFSLSELLPEGPSLVLSTREADQATCPFVEFADDARQTVRLSHWAERSGGAGELWCISAIQGAANAIISGASPPLITGVER